MSVPRLEPRIDWHPFGLGTLEKRLELLPLPFTSADEAFLQLRYVEKYAGDLHCLTIAIESHYIDRDYIEDHSVFYSKSLYPYANSCKRVHFFSLGEADVKQRLKEIVETGIHDGEGAYHTKCRIFSEAAYLGFTVIKPLHGSPVGRTVLRCYPPTPVDPQDAMEYRRDFNCTRSYKGHFAGVELLVRGLAFQQQDVGVSACATTALWSALQKSGDHEAISAATPAQITMLAAKYSLPFGRPMPSEGLNVDQMCQAIHAVGVAPNLFRVEDAKIARAYLDSAIRSGFAPVLILESPAGRHAVAVVGMKVSVQHVATPVVDKIDDTANDLLGLYIHDDRLGPYLRADLANKDVDRMNPLTHKREPKTVLELVIPRRMVGGAQAGKESWTLTHILIPMHAKIRLSFSGLRHVASRVANAALRYVETFQIPESEIPDPTVTLSTWIIRAHKYVERLFLKKDAANADLIGKICTTISLARYVGIVRLSAPYFDPIDIVVDTTSTTRNVHCLGIVVTNNTNDHTEYMGRYLSIVFDCPLVS